MKVLPKLNNQKGLTGVDIVVSMSVIVMTIVVVTMIYVNIDLNSKAVNRASGATRIATTVIEQIEKKYYYEINDEIYRILKMINDGESGIVYDDLNSAYIITGKDTEEKFFNVKIPKGYTMKLKIDNSYGSDESGFDLVKKIDITISYTVGKNLKEVSLSTVKERESVGECNTPALDNSALSTAGLSNSTYTIICIKYSNVLGNYIETTQNDIEWYSYLNGDWARILAIPIVGNTDNKGLYIDSSGNVKSGSGFESFEYVWIPNYGLGKDSVNTEKLYFRYSNGKHKIISAGDVDGKIKSSTGENKFLYMNLISEEIDNIGSCDFGEHTGVWKSTSGTSDIYYSTLNASQYKLKLH